MIDKSEIVNRLDKATDVAISMTVTRGYPIRISKKATLLGNTSIEKNNNGLYDILLPDRTILYGDISVFDVAVIIAQRYNSGEYSVIKKVLSLEERFSKYHTDMIHYLYCLKGAKKRHDLERMAILEDKFQMAEISAKNIRNSISIFKRLK